MNAAIAQVRQTLLRRPQLIDTRRASLRLVAKREKCTPEAAKSMLAEFSQANVIIDLYKASMPDEFKRERGSRMGIARHFWKRLGFPIEEYALRHAISQGESVLSLSIPILPMSGHLCPNCYNFAEIPTDYQLASLLISLDYIDYEDEAQEMAAEHWKHLAERYHMDERMKPAKPIDVGRFESAVAKLKSPLKFLPLIARAMDYNTGCIFFDFDPNEGWPDDIMWTSQNIQWLRRQYKVAQEIQQQIDSIGKWFETNVAERVGEALALYHLINGKRIATGKHARKGKSLVRIL